MSETKSVSITIPQTTFDAYKEACNKIREITGIDLQVHAMMAIALDKEDPDELAQFYIARLIERAKSHKKQAKTQSKDASESVNE